MVERANSSGRKSRLRTLLRICKSCSMYTLKNECPACGITTIMPIPPRYSPEDRYGTYRRRLKKEASVYGEHSN